MSDIQFNEDQNYSYTRYQQRTSGFVSLIIKLGLAKDEKDANKVIVIIGIIAITITIGVFMFGGGGNKNKAPTDNILPAEY